MGRPVRARPIEAVLLDLDGTLVDTREDIASSLNHALGRFGRPPRGIEEVTRFIGDGARELLARGLGTSTKDELDRAVKIFIDHYLEHIAERSRLYPGVRETLERISKRPLAVVTNKPEAHSRSLLQALGIADLIRVTVGGDTVAAKKPAPGPVLEAAKRLGVVPGRALMVGDGPTDMQAGRAAGALTCGVTYGYRTAKEVKDCGPDFVVERFEDLKLILQDGPTA